MKLSEAMIVGICSALIAVGVLREANFAGSKDLQLASQPVFDRVMKSHTLRCAYSSMANYFVTIDPARNITRGLAHDIGEQMGRILNLDIEWVEETAPEKAAGHLHAGDADAMCFPLWPSGEMASQLDYTVPIDYMPIYVFVRADDNRFDGDLSKIDDGNITVPVIAGGAAKDIADQDFHKAAQYSLTDDKDGFHLLLALTQKKADVGFSDPFSADDFMKNNPGTLKYVQNVTPIRVFGESFAVAKGETKLRDMLNVAIEQMQQSGFIRLTLDKYLSDHKGEYLYVDRPYAAQ